jgi:hypothetical protein
MTKGSTQFFTKRIIQLLAVFCFLNLIVTGALGQTVKDYDLKAVFLFNFVQFVEWPPETFPNADAPIVIGVLGEDSVEKSLDQVVRNEIVRERKLVVKRYRRIDEIDSCQILFISQSKSEEFKEVLAVLKGKPVLTVGETEGFALGGGMIRFLTDQNKIRLRINKDATEAAGLTMSSKLLKAAHEIVETVP